MDSSAKTLQEKLSERKIKSPPAIIYPLLANIWKLLFFKKLGVNIKYNIDVKKLKGPFIVVSNHASRLDYIFAGIPFLPHRMNFVAGYNEFFRSHLAFVFRLLQVLPKRNFVPDVYFIKEMSRIIKNGGKVMLFPEGMSSISGSNQPCAIGSGKLLKHYKVPVYYTKISGGYLTSTKYCLDERPGRVDVEIGQLFTPEQLSSMTEDEIQDSLDLKLHHDDYEWNKKVHVKFDGHGEMAKNMHTLLYRCPKCHKDFTMQSQNNRIFCTACGNSAQINEFYDIEPEGDSVFPETPRVWFDMQRQAVKEEIKNPHFEMTERVKLGTLPKYKMLQNQATSEIVGEGTITLNHEGLHYCGTMDGKDFSFSIPSKILPTYGMCTDVSRFYTFLKGTFYEFYPEHETTEKWFLATEELHRMHGGQWHDFKANLQ